MKINLYKIELSDTIKAKVYEFLPKINKIPINNEKEKISILKKIVKKTSLKKSKYLTSIFFLESIKQYLDNNNEKLNYIYITKNGAIYNPKVIEKATNCFYYSLEKIYINDINIQLFETKKKMLIKFEGLNLILLLETINNDYDISLNLQYEKNENIINGLKIIFHNENIKNFIQRFTLYSKNTSIILDKNNLKLKGKNININHISDYSNSSKVSKYYIYPYKTTSFYDAIQIAKAALNLAQDD